MGEEYDFWMIDVMKFPSEYVQEIFQIVKKQGSMVSWPEWGPVDSYAYESIQWFRVGGGEQFLVEANECVNQ